MVESSSCPSSDARELLANELARLAKLLENPTSQEDRLMECFASISANIAYLDADFSDSVNNLFHPRPGLAEPVVRRLAQFMVELTTSQIFYLEAVLKCLAKRLVAAVVSDTDTEELKSEHWNSSNRDQSVALETINAILKFVPLANRRLVAVLRSEFPFFKRPPVQIASYVRNLLRITIARPALRPEVLTLVVQQLVKLDVHASREDILAAEEAENESTAIGSLGGAPDVNGDFEGAAGRLSLSEPMTCEHDISPSASPPPDCPLVSTSTAHPLGNTLDLCMESLFLYIDDYCCRTEDYLDVARLKELYLESETMFEDCILHVHSIYHLQFVMFYFCSLDADICSNFLDRLWRKVQDPNQSLVLRQHAACYLGSLCARALFVDISVVCERLRLWCGWLLQYVDGFDATRAANRDPALYHGAFYAVCQAVMYLSVYRMREFLAMPNGSGLQLLHTLGFERLIKSELNPLKYCHQRVVTAFANVTRNYQLVYCYTIIERNTRQAMYSQAVVVQSGEDGAGGTSDPRMGDSPFQAFFPFDPYVLKKSGRFILPVYRPFCGMDSEDEEEMTVEENVAESFSPGSLEKHGGSLRQGMLVYATSPGFKHV